MELVGNRGVFGAMRGEIHRVGLLLGLALTGVSGPVALRAATLEEYQQAQAQLGQLQQQVAAAEARAAAARQAHARQLASLRQRIAALEAEILSEKLQRAANAGAAAVPDAVGAEEAAVDSAVDAAFDSWRLSALRSEKKDLERQLRALESQGSPSLAAAEAEVQSLRQQIAAQQSRVESMASAPTQEDLEQDLDEQDDRVARHEEDVNRLRERGADPEDVDSAQWILEQERRRQEELRQRLAEGDYRDFEPEPPASGGAPADAETSWNWDDGPTDDAGGDDFDLAQANGLLNDSRGQTPAGGGGPSGAGDDGGYVIDQGRVGGDIAGDKARTRTAHGRREGDHAGRAEASTGTGDVPDPLGRLADAVDQVSQTVQGASETVRGAQDIHDQIRDRGGPSSHDDDHAPPVGDGQGHGGGNPAAHSQSPPPSASSASGSPGPVVAGGGGSGGGGKSPANSGGKPPSSSAGGSSGGGSGGWAVYINHDFLGVGNTERFKPGREKIVQRVGSESAGYAWLCPKLYITSVPTPPVGFQSAYAEYEGKEYRVRADIMDYCK